MSDVGAHIGVMAQLTDDGVCVCVSIGGHWRFRLPHTRKLDMCRIRFRIEATENYTAQFAQALAQLAMKAAGDERSLRRLMTLIEAP